MMLVNQLEDQADVSSMSPNKLSPSKAVIPFDLLIEPKSDPSVSKVVQQLGFALFRSSPVMEVLLNPSSRGLPLIIRKESNQFLMRRIP